jgi:hypothetical protein
MSEDDSSKVVLISVEPLRRTIGPDVEAAHRDLHVWMRGSGPEPDFVAIAQIVVPALERLLDGGRVRVNKAWEERLERTLDTAKDPSGNPFFFRGAVAEVLEIVWWALCAGPPPRGPLAAQMSLGRVKPK